MASLIELSATEISEGVRSGDLSAKEVMQAHLDQIEHAENKVHAFISTSPEKALNDAEKIDEARAQGRELGLLAGVPFAAKDNMNLIGTRTTCASKMLESYESPYTATCVQRLLDADASCVGKTNMDEFAFGSSTESSAFGTTHNPWDLERVPGGSSGGSAAAVAAGEVPLSLGSDTGGSIRQPASFCGVVGMKPTYGVVSRYGVVAFGSSLDQVGPFARNISDVALAMDALVGTGRDTFDTTNVDVKANFRDYLKVDLTGKKIGWVPALMEIGGLSDEVKEAVTEAANLMVSSGAELVDVELPHLEAAISAYYVIAPSEAFSNLARFDGVRYGYQEPNCSTLAEQTSLSRAHGFGLEAKRRQMLGAYLLSSGIYDKYYVAAQKCRTLITEDYKQAFKQADILMFPAAPRSAFKFGELSNPTEMYANDMYTISNNIAGNCGISVPLGLGKESHMPVSVQMQGPSFGDKKLLQFAYSLEQVLAGTSETTSFERVSGLAKGGVY